MKRIFYLGAIYLMILLSGCSTNKKDHSAKNETSSKKVQVVKKEDKNSESEKENADNKKKNTTQDKKEEKNWIPITDPAQAPEGYWDLGEPSYCLGCGKTKEEVAITRYGYCDDCFKKYMEPQMAHCDTCGKVLEGAGYTGTRHIECYHCDYCGGGWTESDYYDPSYGYACNSCYVKYMVGCSQCGKKDDTVDPGMGICWDCQAKNRHSETVCSYCGRASDSLDPQYGLCPDCLNTKNEIESYQW